MGGIRGEGGWGVGTEEVGKLLRRSLMAGGLIITGKYYAANRYNGTSIGVENMQLP